MCQGILAGLLLSSVLLCDSPSALQALELLPDSISGYYLGQDPPGLNRHSLPRRGVDLQGTHRRNVQYGRRRSVFRPDVLRGHILHEKDRRQVDRAFRHAFLWGVQRPLSFHIS